MLEIRPDTFAALEAHMVREYIARLVAWLGEQPDLAGHTTRATPQWCADSLALAQSAGVTDELDVARLFRLRLKFGDDWLRSTDAQEILQSARAGELKVFQLEAMERDQAHG